MKLHKIKVHSGRS